MLLTQHPFAVAVRDTRHRNSCRQTGHSRASFSTGPSPRFRRTVPEHESRGTRRSYADAAFAHAALNATAKLEILQSCEYFQSRHSPLQPTVRFSRYMWNPIVYFFRLTQHVLILKRSIGPFYSPSAIAELSASESARTRRGWARPGGNIIWSGFGGDA